jgi:hypothetical protein
VLDEMRTVFAVMLNKMDDVQERFPDFDKLASHILGTVRARKEALERQRRLKPKS